MIGCKLLSKGVGVSAAAALVLIGAPRLYAQPNGPGLNLPVHCVASVESYHPRRVGAESYQESIGGIKPLEQHAGGIESYRTRYVDGDSFSLPVAGTNGSNTRSAGLETHGGSVSSRETYRSSVVGATSYETRVGGIDDPCK